MVTMGALLLIAAGIGYLIYPTRATQAPASMSAGDQRPPATAAEMDDAQTAPAHTGAPASADVAQHARPALAPPNPADLRSGDANDLATYVSPSDPEPTMAEVIQALRESGEQGGLAAFNPPGTSPPLHGLAVPEDFVLPEGYVRHHQVTDDGRPIEAILMFSPDYVFRDASGSLIPIPEDRVVPADMAPPGLPIRPVTIPPPPE